MPLDLFKPFKIRNLELNSRFVRSATWDGTSDAAGNVTEKSLAIYKELGKANIGMIISGHVFVDVQGQAGQGQYGLYRDEMIPGFRRLTDSVHDGGGKIAAQISHAGMKRYPGNLPALVVSSVDTMERPQQQMTDEDIYRIIGQFSSAAGYAVAAGFDAIQLHGAHGYLVSQFLSPLFNHRTDSWGGNAEKRMTFLLELIKNVRKVIGPDFPLHIKLGMFDEREGGLTLKEGVAVARKIADNGIDAIETSVGFGTVMQRFPEVELPYFRDAAAAVKRVVSIPVMVVGGIRSLEMAQEIIDSGDADFISMCRPFIREPDLIWRWQQERSEPSTCVSCGKCLAEAAKHKGLCCVDAVNLQNG